MDTGEKLVAISAHCPMPNHFHLLVKETTEGGIVKFMSKLLTVYSSYFNKKYSRTGSLFGSEFKSRHLDTDEYLKYMFAYIHLNPLKLVDSHWRENRIDVEVAKKFLDQYKFSSYPEYSGVDREENLILTKNAFPEYFQNVKEFDDYICDWLNFDEPIQALPLALKNGLK